MAVPISTCLSEFKPLSVSHIQGRGAGSPHIGNFYHPGPSGFPGLLRHNACIIAVLTWCWHGQHLSVYRQSWWLPGLIMTTHWKVLDGSQITYEHGTTFVPVGPAKKLNMFNFSHGPALPCRMILDIAGCIFSSYTVIANCNSLQTVPYWWSVLIQCLSMNVLKGPKQ